jgi:hypothetical protein
VLERIEGSIPYLFVTSTSIRTPLGALQTVIPAQEAVPELQLDVFGAADVPIDAQ